MSSMPKKRGHCCIPPARLEPKTYSVASQFVSVKIKARIISRGRSHELKSVVPRASPPCEKRRSREGTADPCPSARRLSWAAELSPEITNLISGMPSVRATSNSAPVSEIFRSTNR